MLLNILKALDKSKYKAIVLCPDGDIIKCIKETGAEVIVAPHQLRLFLHVSGLWQPIFSPYFLKELFPLVHDLKYWTNFIKKMDVAIVHLNSLVLAPYMICAKRAGAKVVCLVQETFARGMLGFRTSILKSLLSRMDAVVFISEYDRKTAKCKAPFTRVVPNWLDLKKYDKNIDKIEARSRLNLPKTKKILMYMGGVSRIKGIYELLIAFNKLKEKKDVLLVIAGYESVNFGKSGTIKDFCKRKLYQLFYGNLSEAIQRYISDNRLNEYIKFIGFVKDAELLYAAADIVVFPALSPHQARPIIEAGAMERPIICSDFECIREFARNGENVIAVPPGNTDKLAAAIEKLLNDPTIVNRIISANYENTRKFHDEAINSERLVEVYDRIS